MSQDSQIAQTDRVLTKRELPRLRFRYGKDERLAFLGHLEVIGTIDRCVRRARLPFSIGNGFARRMRIQFSQALPVGASSCCEYFDVKLTERIDAAEALAMLAAATPPALAPVAAAYVDEPQGALEAWLTRAAWEVEVLGAPVGAAELSSAIDGLRQEGDLAYLRGEKEKHIDLSQALVGFSASDADGSIALALDTRSSNAGALRPLVLVEAALARLGEGPCDSVRVRRCGQWHEGESGCLVKPL